MIAPQAFDVDVAGGRLRVGRWPGRGDAPTALAAHGITANHVSFALLAEALGGDLTLVAPDLRGRGRSNGIRGPFGITAHADDVVRVLDHLGLDHAVLLGHSMGAWVAALAAVRHPERVQAVVLVDGGIALPGTVGERVDEVLQAVLGPAIARLSMTFPDRPAYRDFWRAHPALGGPYWCKAVEAYIDYDLVGVPPTLRSSVSLEAVRADATEQLTVSEVRDVVESLTRPAHLLFAARGLLDTEPLYPPSVIEALRPTWPAVASAQVVAGTNHYTIILGPGARVVADALRAAAGS